MILGGILVFVVVGGGTLGVVLLQNPRVRRIVDRVRGGFVAVMAAQHAPGTDALRAAGCTTAMVIDPRGPTIRPPAEQDAAFRAGVAADLGGPLVMCTVGEPTALTCERIAEIYRGAVPNGAPFSVAIHVLHRKEPACRARFAGDGTRLGDVAGGPSGS